MAYENEVRQLQDMDAEGPVIMPRADRPHGFQESRLNRVCALCARNRASVFHTYATGGRDWPRPGQAAHRG